jgi:KUP system potassium uptake protein
MIPMQAFIDGVDSVQRVPGTAIFLTNATEGAPSAMLHNLKHNKVLHERNVLLTVQVWDRPYVEQTERVLINDLGKGFYRLTLHYGFMETPDIPAALELCAKQNMSFDLMTTSFFVSRALITTSAKPGMTKARERLFLTLSKNAMSASDFFKIPVNRVVEMGTRIEI